MSISQNFPNTRPSLSINFARSQRLDPRITFTRTTTGTRVGPDGYIEVIPADQPRFDFDPVTGECLGLLIEEIRTNSINNNTMVGALVGTPGTPPTSWGIGTNNAELTHSIVGVGVESGISYIDVRVSGTVTASRSCDILMQSPFISASNGQTWTHSVYLRQVGGSQTNITDIRIQGNVYSDTAYITTPWFQMVPVTTESLITQRRIATATLVGETITRVGPFIKITTASSGVVDFTLRIGMPQLELGSFATSVIPTEGSTVTRTTDNARIEGKNFTDFYNPSEGTLYTSHIQKNSTDTTKNWGIFSISNASLTSFIRLFAGAGSASVFNILSSGSGSSVYTTTNGSFVQNNIMRAVCSYSSSSAVRILNNNALTEDTSVVLPSDLNNIIIGGGGAGLSSLNGTISQLTYYPVRLSNQVLQNLTK
jgi:hypothetical protein